MAEKQNPKERLKEITDSIETGIKELFESDKYKSYLQTMSRFHKYSLNNTMLISMQKPDATLVAGFNKWRDGFSRYVKREKRALKSLHPPLTKSKRNEKNSTHRPKHLSLMQAARCRPRKWKFRYPCFVWYRCLMFRKQRVSRYQPLQAI